ncbi:SDR family NAD(P)-dependent oxidoreductase [Citricoccus sp. NPDC079358]|jgi:NAD(P)-dependent dehydrogenase (short-subunit alcohol dehydrogenase family)|uniref:SDR family NAD(P)-dependent oxidoreductase n=1 Tax=Citricoccus sp. NPDC079358 TaxID=3154653 RepID=UPI003450C790
MQELTGRVAVITGGSSGIGRGIALACARAGMTVYVTGRSADHLTETQTEFSGQGLEVATLQVDVTDLAAMQQAAQRIEAEQGRVDLLVNNAGIGLTGAVSDATPADWDWLIDVNIKGVAHGLQAFLPALRRHGQGGHIVNTSSMAGLMPVVAGLYSMSKAAIIALSEALHIELLAEGIGVSAYCPGPTHSNIASSVAQRPAEYGASGYTAPGPEATAFQLTQPYMSAEEAGERVLEGVRRGDMFILTHPEFKAGVVQRHRAIEDSFPEEPLNEERKAAIPFLLSSPVYDEASRPPAPVFEPTR